MPEIDVYSPLLSMVTDIEYYLSKGFSIVKIIEIMDKKYLVQSKHGK